MPDVAMSLIFFT